MFTCSNLTCSPLELDETSTELFSLQVQLTSIKLLELTQLLLSQVQDECGGEQEMFRISCLAEGHFLEFGEELSSVDYYCNNRSSSQTRRGW